MPKIIKCAYCGKETMAQRKTKQFCSVTCMYRAGHGVSHERVCKECGKAFPVLTRGDCNRRYCSQVCSKKANAKRVSTWQQEHPEEMAGYYAKREAHNPGLWREKARAERLTIIQELGGRCIVCGAKNPNWLHVDYIPTTRNKALRHPRHLRFVLAHKSDFRILCANHHYELTLTGRIAGTGITQ